MNIKDCFVGMHVVYNNAYGFNTGYAGRQGVINCIHDDGSDIVRVDFDFKRDFGTYAACLDPDPAWENPNEDVEITMSFDDIFDGCNT